MRYLPRCWGRRPPKPIVAKDKKKESARKPVKKDKMTADEKLDLLLGTMQKKETIVAKDSNATE